MLRTVHSLTGISLAATDGEVGTVEQYYFDDEKWVIRYAVVKTGHWLTGKQVLISPHAIERISESERRIQLLITQKKIKESPDISTDQPVSRQAEARYHDYYRWPYYWTGPGAWGVAGYPAMLGSLPTDYLYQHPVMSKSQIRAGRAHEHANGDTHLRSTQEALGYQVQATDASFGKVEDFLIDDSNWAIRYLIVDTRHFWSQRSVLIPAEFVEAVNWGSKHFGLALPQNVIRGAPAYDSAQLIDREFEKRLYGYYERPGYWEIPNVPAATSVKKAG